jgi:hypothetical protein
MPSAIGWLDQSEEHQRKMREVIDLFSETDSRDELGIAVVRDSLSDLLFPGLSTIQTRARYFLFIPWIYVDLEKRRTPAARLAIRAREAQTRLIYALEAGGERSGVIGIDAKEKLKRLPDSVYWTGLGEFSIRRFRGDQGDYQRGIDRFYRQLASAANHEAEDSDGYRPHNWDLNRPEAPEGLLDATTMQLRADEALYLRERMVTADSDSLLAQLLRAGKPIDDSVIHPWDALDERLATPALLERVEAARWFSEVISGAALLYNLMLAEAATKRNLQSGGVDRVDGFRADLDDWAAMLSARSEAIRGLDQRRLWQLVAAGGGRVPESTRVFLDRWFELALTVPERVAGSADARELIADREYRLKRGNARLQNSRQLEIWGGSSGAGRLTYRWTTGRTMVNDIVSGLANA